MKTLFIAPYFPSLPSWISDFRKTVEPLKEHGFEWLIPTDLEEFNLRASKSLGIPVNITEENCRNRKLSDFTPALGVIYAEELRGYDYWGHTDLDTVMGRLDKFIHYDFDIFSDDLDQINGAFCLYKNEEKTNTLFTRIPNWKEVLSTNNRLWAIDEHEMSDVVKNDPSINTSYNFLQGNDKMGGRVTQTEDGSLFLGDKEIMWYHFNQTNVWPLF